MVNTTNGLENIKFPLSRYGLTVFIKPDRQEGEQMWYQTHYVYGGCKGTKGHVIIHVRSIADINGAGWNHGKFGSGTTTRIN